MKQTVKLTERKLRGMIREAVKCALNEDWTSGRVNNGYGRLETDGYENNGKNVERRSFGDTTRKYNLRNTNDGYGNQHQITARKGSGANGLSYMRSGNGGNDNGQLDSIIGELAEYLGCSVDDVKNQLGNLM